jgi:predicted RNase H-like nuclease
MFFVGIDLAWSTKNGSGVAVLKGYGKKAELISSNVFYSDDEIIDFIKESVKDNSCIIAIDAPLVVPNEEGRRVAEAEVGRLFRRYNAGAHPANRRRLSSWTGEIRGEEITKALESIGFKHDPFIKKYEDSRKIVEVYPHPSMVVLFNLNRILQYKSKPNRDYKFRWGEFKRYHDYLKNLKNAEPSLVLPKGIFPKDIKNLKGGALKNHEDLLDAIFCSYIVYYCWYNPDKCRVLGNMEEGYIMTPVFDLMKEKLKSEKSQRRLDLY